jgi:GntR family transcriptional regulator
MNTPAPTFSPLYRQIKGLIMQSLESGEWRPGEAIPSEIELAASYKVSQGTVRKAIDELAAEKHLLRRQGKGTFVATHDEARAQFRFLRLMPDAGEQEWPASRLLDCKRARASAEVARLLKLRAGDSVVLIRRVLNFADEPTVFEQIYLPGTRFRKLSAAIFNEYKGSMYKLFESEFGTRMIRAEEKIRAVAADAAAAEPLRVREGAPLLCVERVAYSYGDKPVEFRRGYYRTDKHYYRNDIT